MRRNRSDAELQMWTTSLEGIACGNTIEPGAASHVGKTSRQKIRHRDRRERIATGVANPDHVVNEISYLRRLAGRCFLNEQIRRTPGFGGKIDQNAHHFGAAKSWFRSQTVRSADRNLELDVGAIGYVQSCRPGGRSSQQEQPYSEQLCKAARQGTAPWSGKPHFLLNHAGFFGVGCSFDPFSGLPLFS